MKIHPGDTPWSPREAKETEDWHMWNHPLEGVITDYDGTRYYFSVVHDDQEPENGGHLSTWIYVAVDRDEENELINTLPWVDLSRFVGREALIASAVDLRIYSCEYRMFTFEDTVEKP